MLQGRYRVADLRRGQGRYDDAIAILEENLARQRERLGPDDPETLSTLALLGRTHLDAERPEPAGPLLLRAHQGRQRVLGPAHAETLSSALLALWYQRVGQRGVQPCSRSWSRTRSPSASRMEDPHDRPEPGAGAVRPRPLPEARALLERVLVQYERPRGRTAF